MTNGVHFNRQPTYGLKRAILVKLSTLTLFLLVLGAGSAQAAPVISSNTGISSPALTITFSEFSFPSGTPITTQYSSLGVTFVSAFYDPDPSLFQDPQFSQGPRVGNFIDGGVGTNPFSVNFNSQQTAAAFAFQANAGTNIFTALLNGVPVETFSTSFNQGFFGFTNITFNEIRVNAGGPGGFILIDNIQLSNAPAAIPEPATMLLLGTGLAGIAANVRSRRNANKSKEA